MVSPNAAGSVDFEPPFGPVAPILDFNFALPLWKTIQL